MEAAALVAIPPPARVFRVARRGGDPFAPPPWEWASPDGTFGNRFDDPSAERGLTIQERFRVVYCATTAAGAFGESVARFRPSITLLAQLRTIQDQASSVRQPLGVSATESLDIGVVPAAWRTRRVLAQTRLEPTSRFVDLAAPRTHQALRRALSPSVAAFGLHDLDLSAVLGPHRRLTQQCARLIYELCDEDGSPLFAGLRYLSRLSPDWECWAIFADRMRRSATSSVAIAPAHPDMLAACQTFGLRVEADAGPRSGP